MTPEAGAPSRCDLLITGGRVLDPETGFDAVGWVAITGDTITGVGAGDPEPGLVAGRRIEVPGQVVAPGFVDLHSHAQTVNGARLQALDGVTTAFELESGALPVDAHYAWAADHGRPIHYGFSAAWAVARMAVLDGAEVSTPQASPADRLAFRTFERHQDLPRWRGPAEPVEEHRIVEAVRRQLEAGAIGVGLLQGYVPGSRLEELDLLAGLAAEADQPLFVHARDIAPTGPYTAVDAVLELIDASERHGAPIHLCHMNSTSIRRADDVADALLAAQARGVRITTEAYPYPAGSTVIGAAFLAPEQLARNGMKPTDLTYLRTGERVRDADRLRELRESDPGGLCITRNFDLDDPEDLRMLLRCLTFPGAAIGSDAMPMVHVGDPGAPTAEQARRALTEDVWPLPPGLFAHPRSAGCFATALSWVVRELGALDLPEVVRRATVVPAGILGRAVPAMARKARLQPGMDADVTVFDPDRVAPGSDFTALRPSTGFSHVIVAGTPVVDGGELVTTALPGRALTGVPR